MRLRWLGPSLPLLSAWLVACGDDVVDPAAVPLAPLCGEDAPVELLRLDDDEEVGWLRRIGEDGDLHVIVTSADDQDVEPTSRRNAVVDACGEEVIELATDPGYLDHWGDAVVACIGADLVQLSGYDDPSPTVLARRGCAARRVGEQWLTLDVEPEATVGRLVAIDIDGAAITVRELLADVVVGEVGVYPADVDARAVVQTADLAVRSVDPRTGSVVVALEQAHAGAWSILGDRIAYRPPALDAEAPSPLVVRDRRTGAEQSLEADVPMSWWVGWATDDLLTTAPPGPDIGQRWFRLDPLRELVAPEGTHILRARDGGMFWLGRFDETNGEYTLFRWREGEVPQPAMRCPYCSAAPSERGIDHIEVLARTAYAQRFQLWRIDDAGGPPRMLAAEVGGYRYHVMEDDRVLTAIVGGDSTHGPLVLYDGTGGPAVTLAPRVSHTASAFTWLYDVPDEVLYEAVPRDGTHALYRARLAP
jgi:hypothetical protein